MRLIPTRFQKKTASAPILGGFFMSAAPTVAVFMPFPCFQVLRPSENAFRMRFRPFRCNLKNHYKSCLCTSCTKYLVHLVQSSLHAAGVHYTKITYKDHSIKYKVRIFCTFFCFSLGNMKLWGNIGLLKAGYRQVLWINLFKYIIVLPFNT